MAERKKILVVDDEPDLVEMMKMALLGASYDVITAYNGKEGVAKAKQEKPDGIIMDLMMPEMDGFQACKEIKADPETATIPILVLTAIGQHLTHTRYAKSMGLELDSEDYIDKPIDMGILLQRLGKLLK